MSFLPEVPCCSSGPKSTWIAGAGCGTNRAEKHSAWKSNGNYQKGGTGIGLKK